jgi:hypothetical protein
VIDDQLLHLEVAVEQASEPIHGMLDDGIGTTIEFTGWLELMSAVDTARARAPGHESKPDRPSKVRYPHSPRHERG